jgi:hypothetical protein
MTRIAQDALATLFLSLDDERRKLVQRLTRLVLELNLTDDEREQYVAGFILHAVEAQRRERIQFAGVTAPPSVPPDNDVATPPPEPIRMKADDVVRELVRTTPPPPSKPRRASGEN